MTTHHRFLLTPKNSTTTSTTSPPSSKSSAAAEPPQAVNVESDFVVILAALLCALICVVGLIAVARCAWLRQGGTTTANNDNTGRRRRQPSANKGLKKKILQSLPKNIYDSNSTNGGTKSADCAICLAEYVDGDEIRVLPQCGHDFHVHCIDTWLGSHSSCPSCRQILVVARCHKCGELPAMSSGVGVSATPAGAAETRIKVEQDCGSASSSSNNYLP